MIRESSLTEPDSSRFFSRNFSAYAILRTLLDSCTPPSPSYLNVACCSLSTASAAGPSISAVSVLTTL